MHAIVPRWLTVMERVFAKNREAAAQASYTSRVGDDH